jgi:co-chaperonin GroES (HSP10)
MERVGLNGDTSELRWFRESERMTDGTTVQTRSQRIEEELVGNSLNYSAQSRADLLRRAEASPAILRGWSITPLEDRILVEFAPFDEGYVCESCKGSGRTEEKCNPCGGSGKIVRSETRECIACDASGEILPGKKCNRCGGVHYLTETNEVACESCKVVGAHGTMPMACGFVPCGQCGGSGLAPGVMAVPDTTKQDHSYGDILTCGSEVFDLRPGDRVLFSKMAGIYVVGDRKRYCLLRRGEIMGYMRYAG